VITVTQNTISIPFEISFVDQYFFHARYYFINWKNEEFKETFDSHTLNLGGEVKGFGKGFYWIGSGLDIFYQAMGQKRGYTYDSSLNAFGFAIPLNWYPLAFHGKNHNLKISFIYGLFKYSSKKNLFSGGVLETGSGTNSSIMFRVSYTF
ncbi:MAG: hypothetical protein OEV44_12830, partial [Spirochaetota bacterium]|nr:hypothetical protein [Spirochaetota bacterium]